MDAEQSISLIKALIGSSLLTFSWSRMTKTQTWFSAWGFDQTWFPTVTAPMSTLRSTRSPALGRAAGTPVPKLSVTQPRPSPLSLGHHSLQWPLCEAVLVHTMWDCQPPQSTGLLLPLTPQQGNDWETRGLNKCPFVLPAWKLWRQHKLIPFYKVGQTITWTPPGWTAIKQESEEKTGAREVKPRFLCDGWRTVCISKCFVTSSRGWNK